MNSYIETEGVINMRRRTVRLDREGDYWTDEEKQKLVQKFLEGEGITAIALELQRSEPAIYQMIEKLTSITAKASLSVGSPLLSPLRAYVKTARWILHYVPAVNIT